MKGLNILQPWASLLAETEKRIETRSWMTRYRGDVLICSSKRWDGALQRIAFSEPFRSVLGYDRIQRLGGLPLGSALAVARLADVRPIHSLALSAWKLSPKELAFGDYSSGRYAWFFEDVRPLSTPVSVKGQLGLWDVPKPLLKTLRYLDWKGQTHA